MRIGLFGGSFNPPHKMHKFIAEQLIENNYVDKIIYIPTGNKYNKKELIEFKHRYNMLKIMVDDTKQLEVSDYEDKNTLTYTYQTLDYFKNKYKNDEIYFICGSDNIKQITTWKNYEYILENYKTIVIRRNDDNLEKILTTINNKNILLTKIKTSDLSSTKIRNLIKINCEKNLLDLDVKKYIEANKLYME